MSDDATGCSAASARWTLRLVACGLAVLCPVAHGYTWVSSAGNPIATVTAVADLAYYVPDDPAPALLHSDNAFLAPRLSLFVDAGDDRVRVHALLRADRGFDPGAERDGDVRADEYWLDARLGDAVELRVGKFATAFGAWVGRHLASDNPFVTPPALYDDVLPITDAAAPASALAFLARRNEADRHATWVPVVWGPSYASGARLSATASAFDLAVEVKNAALSARPETWDLFDDGFDTDPTLTARLGARPAPEWTLGASTSRGPYLRERAQISLPVGTDVDDFEQTTTGFDVAYAHRGLAVWAEIARFSFDVPRLDEVDGWSGFVELKQKFAVQWWGAIRFNRSTFDDTPGSSASWNRGLDRLDLALGYRHDVHVAGKLQWSVTDESGGNTDGKWLVAAQAIVQF